MDRDTKELAKLYLRPKICRFCYATVHEKAKKCRKCHSNDLRTRKKIPA